jgi:hypothetical protein
MQEKLKEDNYKEPKLTRKPFGVVNMNTKNEMPCAANKIGTC